MGLKDWFKPKPKEDVKPKGDTPDFIGIKTDPREAREARTKDVKDQISALEKALAEAETDEQRQRLQNLIAKRREQL